MIRRKIYRLTYNTNKLGKNAGCQYNVTANWRTNNIAAQMITAWAEPGSRKKWFILVNREAPQSIYLLFYIFVVSSFLFPSWCGYMAYLYCKINTCLVIYSSWCESVVISPSSENERSWSVIFSCKAVGCSKKMRCQHRTSWKCYCVCVGLQNKIKCTCFENIFCPSLPAKSQKKLNLPKRQLAKLHSL